MSVQRAQSEISSAEFAEWVAFNRKYPFVIDRAEYAMAINSAILANTNSKNRSYSYDDFLLQPEKKIQDAKAMEKTLEALYGGNK